MPERLGFRDLNANRFTIAFMQILKSHLKLYSGAMLKKKKSNGFSDF